MIGEMRDVMMRVKMARNNAAVVDGDDEKVNLYWTKM